MNKHKKYLIYIFPVIITLFTIMVMVLAAWPGLIKPLVMDEIDFAAVSRAIKDTGLPIYYRGESLSHMTGLWHPPFYIIILAAWQLIFGSAVMSYRAFGLFAACLTLLTTSIFFIRRINWSDMTHLERLTNSLPLLIGLGIAATSPLFIQGSMLLDIDTQILPLLIILVFLILFELRHHNAGKQIYWAVYVLGLAILFFTKLTTPLLLVPTFVFYELFYLGKQFWQPQLLIKDDNNLFAHCYNFHIRKMFWRLLLPIAFGILGLIFFLLVWFIIAQLLGWDFSYPFHYLTRSSQNPASYSSGLSEFFHVIITEMPGRLVVITQWAGLGNLLIFLVLLAREVFKPIEGILQRQERLSLLFFSSMLICMYIILKPAPYMFPKYIPPFIPLFSLLVIDLLVAFLRRNQLLAMTIWITGGLIFYLAFIGFRYPNEDFTYNVYTIWPRSPIFWGWILLPLTILIIVNLLETFIIQKHYLVVSIVASLLAVTLGWQIAVIAKHATVTYSTAYYYGENSLIATAKYLQEIIPDKAIVIAPKDVGFLIEKRIRYVELGSYDPRPAMEYSGTEYFIMRSGDGFGIVIQNTPEIWNALNEQFKLVHKVGEFMIFQRKRIK